MRRGKGSHFPLVDLWSASFLFWAENKLLETDMSRSDLLNAKRDKQNEFYTLYEVIQAELNHYEDKFKNKTVFCNCDDPFESNFFRFFVKNFNYLGLKRLICTCYKGSPENNGDGLKYFLHKKVIKQTQIV